MKKEIKELENLIERAERLYYRCWICGSDNNITKHSLTGNHQKPFIILCRPCHDDIENYKEIIKIMRKQKRISVTNFKKLLKSFETTN